mmetsp:Transcript_47710/g.137797  ORF Transcript_47710/g.137797 Transcript_47710/m.137797 type:complete len:235 (-) Transcript_47710:1141-1845(-)
MVSTGSPTPHVCTDSGTGPLHACTGPCWPTPAEWPLALAGACWASDCEPDDMGPPPSTDAPMAWCVSADGPSPKAAHSSSSNRSTTSQESAVPAVCDGNKLSQLRSPRSAGELLLRRNADGRGTPQMRGTELRSSAHAAPSAGAAARGACNMAGSLLRGHAAACAKILRDRVPGPSASACTVGLAESCPAWACMLCCGSLSAVAGPSTDLERGPKNPPTAQPGHRLRGWSSSGP